MAQTVIGLFDTVNEAQNAAQALINQGFNRDHIDISSNDDTATGTNTSNYNDDSISGFFGSLFGTDNDDYNNYSEVARRGSVIVTVHAQSTEEAQTAARILDQYNAIDVNERATQFRGATNTETAQADTSIPVIEEQMQIGKQVVETGGARLRSRIVERPVEENLRLREEHVRVERNPVNRPATEADLQTFREGEIEITERAEVPVVAKEARVVEEVSLGKETTERTETIRDTVRGTEVEVERMEGDVDIDNERRTRAANT